MTAERSSPTPGERPSDPRVDDLREQLRALGYLDARVDRFVLGGTRHGRATRLAGAASVRIGLLAGVLLGPPAAWGAGSRVPGLVTSATDAIVLALYLAVLFGVGAGVVALGAIVSAGWIARRTATRPDFAVRARRAAVAAGLVVAAGCLAYLTLWWQAAAGSGAGSPIGSPTTLVIALVIAVAISILLGHVVTITVLASLARLGRAQSLPHGSPLSSWRAILPISLVALAGAAGLLVASAPAADPATDAPPLAVVPTGARLLVIAIDGVDVPTLDRLVSEGRLPTWATLVGQARAALAAEPDRDPARVWTSVATGQPPERHGIRTLESRRLPGVEGRLRPESPALKMLTTATDLLRLTTPTLASGDERRQPAFWEVAASAGLRTAVVHWWATWPAPDAMGVVLSDRAILRLEQGGSLDGELAPAGLYERLLAGWPARRARLHNEALTAVPAGTSQDVAAILTRSAGLDATVVDLATDSALGTLDVLTVYLPGLDIAQHALFGTESGALASSAAAERVRSLEAYYAFLDRALFRLRSANARDLLTLLVTQPGRVPVPSPGLAALSGALASTARVDAAATSVAPTVLFALGVPIATDLAATPLSSLLSESFRAAHPVRSVATYGIRRHTSAARSGQPLDKQMIERMRSLGYVR